MKNKDDNNKKEHTTKYGEMIPTNFEWLGIEEQKRIAKKLANIGNETKNKGKK